MDVSHPKIFFACFWSDVLSLLVIIDRQLHRFAVDRFSSNMQNSHSSIGNALFLRICSARARSARDDWTRIEPLIAANGSDWAY
jgi:hypothetical protein